MISLGLRYFLEVARCGSIAGAASPVAPGHSHLPEPG